MTGPMLLKKVAAKKLKEKRKTICQDIDECLTIDT